MFIFEVCAELSTLKADTVFNFSFSLFGAFPQLDSPGLQCTIVYLMDHLMDIEHSI